MSNFKRTRSQLALPDFDIHQLARSPLKDAKIALRNLQSTPPHNSAAPNGTDDEDLESFKKHMKRASSPFKDSLFVNERTPKRLRHEDQRAENRPPPHRRGLSPVTSQHHPLHTTGSPRRSQSVPILSSVPHIDLHHVPRSPGKSTTELRIASVPLASSERISNQDNTLMFETYKEPFGDVSSISSTPPHRHTASAHLPLSPLTPLPTTPGPSIPQLTPLHGLDPQPSSCALTDTLSVGREDHVAPPASTSKLRLPGTSFSRLPRPSAVPVPMSRREDNRKKPTSSKNKRNHQAGVTTATPNILSRRITRSASLRHRESIRKEAHSEGGIAPSVKPSITVTTSNTNVASDRDASSSSTSSKHDSANSSSIASSKKTRQPTLFSFARPTASSSAKSSAPPHTTNIASARRPTAVTKEDTQDNASLASSLSSLSNALQRLNMPPPSRPSTSMGFNHTEPSADSGFNHEDGFGNARTRDDMDIASIVKEDDNNVSLIGRSAPLKRAATMNSLPVLSVGLRQSTLMLPPPLPRQPADAKRIVQTSLLVDQPGNKLRFGRNDVAVQSGRDQPRPRIFAVAGSGRSGASLGSRVVYKASKKTSLPSVEGSPTKSNPTSSVLQSATVDGPAETSEERITNSLECTASGQANPFISDAVNRSIHVDELSGESSQSVQERDTSRRASLASLLFSQPPSSLPQTPVSQPSATQALVTSPGKGKRVARTPTSIPSNTDMKHLVRTAPAAISRTTSMGARISGRKTGVEFVSSPREGSSTFRGLLEVLKDCTIFVDVRTDDGDDAGALFVDMLKGMGARILTRVGQTCTHIVYKNGLVSTLTRYRLLKEPRPLAVGIAWVVECAEQRSHVDEARFLISLDEENVAGMNKRRRSMLPKQIQSPCSIPANSTLPSPSSTSFNVEENAVAAAGKTPQPLSPMTDDASSPPHTSGSVNVLPLENARRRRSMVFGS